MKTCLKTLLGLALVLVVEAAAHAQTPISRPTVSPWLNLYRGGNSANLNYYNLVRPEMDFRGAIGQLQVQTNTNQQSITDLTTPAGPLVTGHAAGFMTHRSFFQTQAAGGTGGNASVAGGFSTANRPKATAAAGSTGTTGAR
jgi:hypothetical protein